MTRAARALLQTLENLTDADKHELAVEIVRRCLRSDSPHLSDNEMTATAEQVFLELDSREAADAGTTAR